MSDQTVIRADDLLVTGNLKVTGTSNLSSVINTTSTDLVVKDRLITLNNGGALTGTAGIEFYDSAMAGANTYSLGSNIHARIGYTTASGFDFSGKDITTTGTISGIFNLAVNNVNDTHIDFGLGANQVNTDDIPEGAKKFYNQTTTYADADARIAAVGVTSGKVANWDTAYGWGNHASAGYLASADFNTTFDNRLATKTTDNLTEGANLYFTDPRADARADLRIAAANINDLNDVNTAGITDGYVLMYNGSEFVAQAPALGVANYQLSSDTSATKSNVGTSYSAGTVVATIPSFNISTDGYVQVAFTANITTETVGGATIALFRATNGAGMSYATPIAEYGSATQGFNNAFIFNDNLTGSTTAVQYQVAVKFASGSTNSYVLSNMSFSATEFATTGIDTIPELTDVTISSQQAGQILYANGPTTWINQTPNISLNSDVNVSGVVNSHVLQYNGANSRFENVTPAVFAGTMQLGHLGDVNTSGIASGSILKYDGSNWIISSGFEELTEVVEDTTPQLGGDLDVNGNNITGTAVSITTSNGSDGNITLDPDGVGKVQINGDLTVTGTATTLEVSNVEVEDQIMLLNKTGSATSTNDSGIMVDRGSSVNNAVWFWDHADSRWTAATTIDGSDKTGNITETALADIEAGTAHLTATAAQYADLAEVYESDDNYEPGTVVVFGGDKEVTQCKMLQDLRVAGVVSTNPAYLMNKDGDGVSVALRGKVPCKVEGPVRKGDVLVTNVTPGTACTLTDDSPTPPGFAVIGKSLETNNDTGIRLINIVV